MAVFGFFSVVLTAASFDMLDNRRLLAFKVLQLTTGGREKSK